MDSASVLVQSEFLTEIVELSAAGMFSPKKLLPVDRWSSERAQF